MGFWSSLGQFASEIAEEVIKQEEEKNKKIEEAKKTALQCDYDFIVETIEEPGDLGELYLEGFKQAKEVRDHFFLMMDTYLPQLEHEQIMDMYNRCYSIFGTERYEQTMKKLLEFISHDCILYNMIYAAKSEYYDDYSYDELMNIEQEDETIYADKISLLVISDILKERNETIEDLCNEETLEDMDGDDFIDNLIGLKFGRTDQFGQAGDTVYNAHLKEFINNRQYLMNQIIDALIDSDEYAELDYDNKSNKWLINAYQSDDYDILDKIIISNILNNRGYDI